MVPSANQFIEKLTQDHRVIVIGGLAVMHISEFASDGDPFSQAILEKRTIPPA